MWRVTIEEPETVETPEFVESYDNIIGMPLDGKLVAEGRKLEMEYMRELDVREIIPLDRCAELTGARPIPVRWVDVNKGDETRPEIRCRLVVVETARRTTIEKGDVVATFASTPPLEALRFLLSAAVTGDPNEDQVVRALDISRAHLHSPVKRTICVEAPPEDDECPPGHCWLLQRNMYGTKDDANAFDTKVEKSI